MRRLEVAQVALWFPPLRAKVLSRDLARVEAIPQDVEGE